MTEECTKADKDTKLIEAAKILGHYTRYRYRIYDLMGPRNARTRQLIMLTLTGNKLPQTKCGVNVLKDEFYKRTGITGDCEAAREDNFTQWCFDNIVGGRDFKALAQKTFDIIKEKGINWEVTKKELMDTVAYGYEDMAIGHFVRENLNENLSNVEARQFNKELSKLLK